MLGNRLSSGFSSAIYICGCPLNCGLVKNKVYVFAIKLVLV